MKTIRIIKDRPAGFLPEFAERPAPLRRSTHYCPGCGHGVLHKIVAEAIADFGIKDRTTFISPVGCAVFGYYYMDCFGISTPHGRAPAVATGLSRAHGNGVVISYQGDGDLAAIGFNEFIHTVNRGENICYIFVNNAIYGMTGGQMAPTTLVGQKTSTTPRGRDAALDGLPFRVAEIVASQPNPVYVERVALSTPKEIMKARAAIRKAIKNTAERKGLSFVEVLFNHVRILSGSLHRLPIHAEHTLVLLSKSLLQKRGILRISQRDDPSAFPFQSPELPKQKSHFLQPRKSNGRSSAAIFRESNLNVTRTFRKENVWETVGSHGIDLESERKRVECLSLISELQRKATLSFYSRGRTRSFPFF